MNYKEYIESILSSEWITHSYHSGSVCFGLYLRNNHERIHIWLFTDQEEIIIRKDLNGGSYYEERKFPLGDKDCIKFINSSPFL